MNVDEIIEEFEKFVYGKCPGDFKGVCHYELMENVLVLLKMQKEIIENENKSKCAKG